jgi:CRISPR/Cas system-associated endonuclease Cas3-HD
LGGRDGALKKSLKIRLKNMKKKQEKKDIFNEYILGMSDMLIWIKSLPIGGSAGRMLDLHLYPIHQWMEKVKKTRNK